MSKKKKQCDHEWEYTHTEYLKGHVGYRNLYQEVKVYKCSLCNEIKKDKIREEASRNEPMWWR